jgi:hypothetical protein
MSQLSCKCGHVISDTTDDLSWKGEVIADGDYEFVWAALAELQGNTDQRLDTATGIRIRHSREVYECISCGRLWVQREPGTKFFVSYSSDSKKVEYVLAPTGRDRA